MTYTTQKIGRNRTNILNAETGELVCQLLNKEVAGWLRGMELAAIKDAEHAVAQRGYRIEATREYLAKRAARSVGRGVQLELL